MDFIKSIFFPFSERAKSHFFGTFIVSWAIINWKILFTIFFFGHSDFHGQNIVDFIETHYLNNACKPFLFPLTSSLIYIFLWPYVDLELFKFVEKNKRTKIDEKIKIGREHLVQGNLYYDLKLDF